MLTYQHLAYPHRIEINIIGRKIYNEYRPGGKFFPISIRDDVI